MTLWTPTQVEAKDWQARGSGLLLPPKKARFTKPLGIELFAGAGGFSVGFHEAGFHMIAALEYDYFAAMTYMTNLSRWGHLQIHFDTPEREAGFKKTLEQEAKRHEKDKSLPTRFKDIRAGTGWIASQPPDERGCEHFWIADARNVTGKQILDAIGLEPGDIDVVCGGPPCQGYSVGGKRNVMDERNSLVFEYARLVLEIKPKAFVMENVQGIITMLTPQGVPVLDQFCRILEDGGFGTFESLKKGLLASSGAGMAVSGKKVDRGPKRKPAPILDDDDPDDPDYEDHDLFTEAVEGRGTFANRTAAPQQVALL